MTVPESSTRPPIPLANYFLLLLLATLWGSSYTLIKIGVETIPPITFIAARTIVAGLLLFAILKLRGVTMPWDLKSWRLFAFQALMNSAIPFTLIAWAETHVDAGLATILNSTTPIFTFLIGSLIIGHEPATGWRIVGMTAGIAGIILIIGIDALGGLGKEVVAQLAILFATICYAIAALFGKVFKSLDSMIPATGSLLCGAAMLIPVSLIVDKPWALTPSANSILALIVLAVFSTALAFVLFFRLLRSLGSVGVTSQAYLRVPIGVVIGVVFLGEMLPSTALIGLVLVMGGVAAMTMPAKKRVISKS